MIVLNKIAVYTKNNPRTYSERSVPNISVPFGQAKMLTPSETLSADSADYLGNLIARNKRPEMYGNIRGVINENGQVGTRQQMNLKTT